MSGFNVLPSRRPVSRRGFLGGCAACAAAGACPALASPALPSAPAGDKARVRLVFSHPAKPIEGWPYLGYDYGTRKAEILKRLREALPDVEFDPVTPTRTEDAADILASGSKMDGFLVYLLGIPSPRVAAPIATSGRPTILVDDLYGGTGEFLRAFAGARRKGFKVAGVSSSRFEDVVQAVRTFETLKKLKSSVILDVCERQGRPDPEAIRNCFGCTVRTTSAEEINDAYRKADQAESRKWADTWVRAARKVAEPSREEIGKSGVMYVAMRDMMAAHKAQALDIDCLRLFYGNKLPAYPCLGLHQFNDDGLVGACEADLKSTITMLSMAYLVGRPGFISDPVIDTAKNQIIYAHCVAPTKVYGPKGPKSPYAIRDHSEDRKGAVVQSFLPLGQMTTTFKLDPVRKEIVFHQGKSVANIDEDRACRTKLAVEVKDPWKLLTEWDRWGWHRVTYFGDLRAPVETFAALAGFSMVVEG